MENKASAYSYNELKAKIFSITGKSDFEKAALEIFRLQYEQNKVYHSYASALGKNTSNVVRIGDIPFLPVSFFKTHDVVCGETNPKDTVFYSSTTTSGTPSKHIVKDTAIYTESFRNSFAHFYGDIKDHCVLALLPSYLERKGSSLVFMAEDMVKQSANPHSGFYLHNFTELKDKLTLLEKQGQKTLLLGVTYALLDLAEQYPVKLSHTTIMETGGMKGKRKELPRAEVHNKLCEAFSVKHIHSEYGMTELLSQAYSNGEGAFHCPPWMKIVIRDIYDPLNSGLKEQSGAVNIIDLANINSCSFIATDDMGIVHNDGSFEISGRLDQSDIRGCNLMAEEL